MKNKKHTNYPTRYAISEKVSLDFNISGKITNCIVDGVSFDICKVYYDIAIPVIKKGRKTRYTIIRNIDSCFVADSE